LGARFGWFSTLDSTLFSKLRPLEAPPPRSHPLRDVLHTTHSGCDSRSRLLSLPDSTSCRRQEKVERRAHKLCLHCQSARYRNRRRRIRHPAIRVRRCQDYRFRCSSEAGSHRIHGEPYRRPARDYSRNFGTICRLAQARGRQARRERHLEQRHLWSRNTLEWNDAQQEQEEEAHSSSQEVRRLCIQGL
ncbi:hypothetical protein PFISCL1PPCAC_4587, partial [Pristionchus fissidentatus]